MLDKVVFLYIAVLLTSQAEAIDYIVVNPFDSESRAYIEILSNHKGKLCARYYGLMTCFDIRVIREEDNHVTFILYGTTYRQVILNRAFTQPECYAPDGYMM